MRRPARSTKSPISRLHDLKMIMASKRSAIGEPQYGRGGSDGLGVFAQGNLEQSNVDITSELMSMIAAQQAYNGSSRALQAGSEMIRTAAEQLG
ncbi:MAG: hypothetical protein EBT35_08775 [Alphaproteobacteria bacterium]|nr:hypothetical protein [Alphaproteobacteria bacterium]